MSIKDLENTLGQAILDNSRRKGHDEFGEYGPSQISGCPLKTFLDEMTDTEVPINRWVFGGSAVHYYLQKHPGLLPKAIEDAGFHLLDTHFEVETHYTLSDDIWISGRCDVLTHDGDQRVIIDLKYSSIPPHSGHGRIYKYLSQLNAYANMFDANEMGLLMVNSKSDHIPSDIGVITGEPDENNWDILKSKARMVHRTLEEYEYDEGNRWTNDSLADKIDDFWEHIMSIIDKEHCPSYEKECQYCDHKSYCPVYQGKTGGLKGMGNRRKD